MHWRVPSILRAFLSPQTTLGDLDAASAAALIAAAADIALIIDREGLVRDVAIRNESLAADLPGAADWVGRPFAQTVALDSRPKAAALLREPEAADATQWRHLNHLAPDGSSVPVLYRVAPFGEDGQILAFGRDLRAVAALQQRLVNAQQSLEHEYARLREAELRYRLLFRSSAEAVLIVDAARARVAEANPAAGRLLGSDAERIVGRPLTDLLGQASHGAVQAHLAAVRSGGTPDIVAASLADGTAVHVAAALFREGAAALFLVRLQPADAGAGPRAIADDARGRLLGVVDRAPDGLVLTDQAGSILAANAAFVDMAQLAGQDGARGRPLDRWLGESALDLEVLISNLRQRGSVRFFATSLRDEHGGVAQVEVSAVCVADAGQSNFGFVIRNTTPRLRGETRLGRDPLRSVEQLTELVGRVALKDLVRESTDVIERLCIEAALQLTGDNRASAAELLGVSRQSLYVKLRRYGLLEQDEDDRS